MTVMPSRPTARITGGDNCWLPRPNRKPWPPVTPTTMRPGRPRTSARHCCSVRSAATNRPSANASTPSRVPSVPSRRLTARALVPGPTSGTTSGASSRTMSSAAAARAASFAGAHSSSDPPSPAARTAPARRRKGAATVGFAATAPHRCPSPRPPATRLPAGSSTNRATTCAAAAGVVANTPECILTPAGMPSSGSRSPTHRNDVARRPVAAGKDDQLAARSDHRSGGAATIGGRRCYACCRPASDGGSVNPGGVGTRLSHRSGTDQELRPPRSACRRGAVAGGRTGGVGKLQQPSKKRRCALACQWRRAKRRRCRRHAIGPLERNRTAHAGNRIDDKADARCHLGRFPLKCRRLV